MPAIVVEKDIREGTIKELVLKNTITPIYTQIAWHKDKWMTSPLQQFIDVTRESFDNGYYSGEIFVLYVRRIALLYIGNRYLD